MTKPAPSKLYRTPSGLGGAFDVRIIEHKAEDRVLVKVDMRNPDWDGYQFVTTADQLTEIKR